MNDYGWDFLILTVFLFLNSTVESERIKHILLYTPLHMLENWHLDGILGTQQYFIDNNCPAINCIVTRNHSYLPSLSDYDVIALNSWNVPSLAAFPPPETRHSKQIYVMHFRESPIRTTIIRTKTALSEYSQLINWTMSHR